MFKGEEGKGKRKRGKAPRSCPPLSSPPSQERRQGSPASTRPGSHNRPHLFPITRQLDSTRLDSTAHPVHYRSVPYCPPLCNPFPLPLSFFTPCIFEQSNRGTPLCQSARASPTLKCNPFSSTLAQLCGLLGAPINRVGNSNGCHQHSLAAGCCCWRRARVLKAIADPHKNSFLPARLPCSLPRRMWTDKTKRANPQISLDT
jgi:hypothetical protein